MSHKSLISGGAGFLGSHLCDALIQKGHDILCVDNFFTGNKDNVSHLISHSKFELIRHDVTFPLYVEVDQIYNLACPASPIHYQYDPVQTTKTSVHGAINMLGLAKRTGARILQASTSEVYGDPEVHPQTEDYWGRVNPIGSPRMHPNDGRVVSNFIVQALQNKPITIYGDGSQTRSFCYVSDLIEGMIKFMESDKTITGPINIGNPNEFTMLELAELILKLTSSQSKIIFKSLPEDDPKQRQPDISLAKDKLGWEPKIKLEDGLNETIKYFRELLKS